MATSPLKDEHARIPRGILEQLAHINLAPYESRCLFFLLRKTYGHEKEQVQISKLQWEEGTGLLATHVYRTLRRLMDRKIVTKNGHQYGVQKDYSLWKVRERPKPPNWEERAHHAGVKKLERTICLFCKKTIDKPKPFQVLCEVCE